MAERQAGMLTIHIDTERERLVAELARVNEQLAAARLERDGLRSRIEAFAILHDRAIAPLYADLDAVKADIAELLAHRSGSPTDRDDALRARERADRSARAAARVEAEPDDDAWTFDEVRQPRPEPTEESRTLFRSLMKRCHPDLAVDDADRGRRDEFSRAVNDAYASGDTDRLRSLTLDWDLDGGAPAGLALSAAELEELIAAANDDLDAIREEIVAVERSGLGRLLLASVDPIAAVNAVARRVSNEIGRQWRTLRRLRDGGR